MKKYNLCLWLAALVGLFASCSQDENAMLQTNESKRVSLTAELPDDFAQIGTRALLPTVDNHTLRCILEVWTKDQTPVLKHREEQINLSGDNVVFEFTIDAGTYDCLFWADFIGTTPGEDADATIGDVKYKHYDDKYYATNTENGLKAISIIDGVYAAGFNTDARDAFFGKYELKKEAAAIENPTIPSLTRPFAKLTIKEKDATNYANCNGLTAEYEVPTTFNVSTGAVGDTKVPVTCNNKSSESQILFSDYIFTDATSTLGEVTLNFTSASEKTFQDVTIPAGIPLKRNFRTNASGNLITEKPAPTPQVKMTVTMDANWGGEDVEKNLDIELAKEVLGLVEEGGTETDGTKRVFKISTEAQLRAMHVLIAGIVEMSGTTTNKTYAYATYKLMNDINLNNVPWTPIGLTPDYTVNLVGIFDGQGHTISGLNVSTTEQYAGFFGGIGREGIVKHLAVKGTVTGPGYVGGIASLNAGVIAYCSFEGNVILTKNGTGARIGGISGWNTKEITSCFANTTPEIPSSGSGGVSKGGIAGTAGTTVQGCTWYYNSTGGAAGIEACYQGWNSGSDTNNKNASYSDNSGLNSRVSDMNSYNAADYDYQWKAADGTLILRKKE